MLQIFKDLPEPIDLELDLMNRTVYWNDQRDSPLGNTVSPAPMDVSAGDAPRVLIGGLQEAIGLGRIALCGRRFHRCPLDIETISKDVFDA
jgi:hypothetical protein